MRELGPEVQHQDSVVGIMRSLGLLNHGRHLGYLILYARKDLSPSSGMVLI